MADNKIKKGAKLSQKDKDALAELKNKGHSRRHIMSMQMHLLKGKSFETAHDLAMKSVGK